MEGEEEESDDPHSLGNQGFWKKVAVFAAGAAMNFLVGVLILLALNMGAKGFLLPVIQGGAPEFVMDGEGYAHLFGANTRVTTDFADRAGSPGAVFMALFRDTARMTLSLDANGGSLRTDVAADARFPVSFVLESDSSDGVRLPGADVWPAAPPGTFETPTYGEAGTPKAAPFVREGYLLSGWKFIDAKGQELSAELTWAKKDGADVREGTGSWYVELPRLTDAPAGKVSITAVAQWEALPYRVAYLSEGAATGRFDQGLSYALPDFRLAKQGDLDNDGMTLISWAVSRAAQAAAWAPDERVSLLDVLAAAKAAGQGAPAGDGEDAGTLGYVIWDTVLEREVDRDGPDTVREVRLHAGWTGQVIADVPTRMVLLFDEEMNSSRGGFKAGAAQITTTGRQDLEVAAVRAGWDTAQGLSSIWRVGPNGWGRFGETKLSIKDLDAGVKAEMDTKTDPAVQTVETTDAAGNVTTALANAMSNVACGFAIPKATDAGPGVLNVEYDVVMDTRQLGAYRPRPPAQFDPEHPENSAHICQLVYTIALAS